MSIRRMFPVLFVAVFAVAAWPGEAAGQVSSCWLCTGSEFQPDNGSTVCRSWYWGADDCVHRGSEHFHWCDLGPDFCFDDVFSAADEMAVEGVRAGQLLPMEGDYVVLTEADDIVILRRCGAEVARFAVSELKAAGDRTGSLAIGPGARSEHPDIPVAATALHRRVLEE